MTPDAAHTDPLLTIAEMNLDLAARRANCRCCPVRPSRADALAALDQMERHAGGCEAATAVLRAYLRT